MSRTAKIEVRCTEVEKARILERAVAAGLKVSEYVRRRALCEPLPGVEPVRTTPGQTSADSLILAAEIEEAGLDEEAAHEAFLERRSRQLVGSGSTSIVARREAQREWEARGGS